MKTFHILVVAFSLTVWMLVGTVFHPVGGFARYHLTDLACGFMYPSLVVLTSSPPRIGGMNWNSLQGKLILTAVASLLFEGLAPLIKDSTADPIDVLCYFAGALVQHGLVRLCDADRRPKLDNPRV